MDCSLRTADSFPVVGSLPPKNSGLLITRKIYKLFTYPQCITITLTKLITKFIYMYSLIQYVLIILKFTTQSYTPDRLHSFVKLSIIIYL